MIKRKNINVVLPFYLCSSIIENKKNDLQGMALYSHLTILTSSYFINTQACYNEKLASRFQCKFPTGCITENTENIQKLEKISVRQ